MKYVLSACLFFCVTTFGSLLTEPPQNYSNQSNSSAASITALHHYVFFGRDREQITERAFLDSKIFGGAQLTYAWKELEPSEGIYDFSAIRSDLELLTSKGKKLFIQLQDATFDPISVAIPLYLLHKKEYKGGVTYQYDSKGQPEGRVALRWVASVQKRFHELLTELGKEFDGKIEGINLQETAIGVDEQSAKDNGFTYSGYRDAILLNMQTLKKCFSKSVAMQYLNFMPGEWLPTDDRGYLSSLYEHARGLGISAGAPDLLPDNVNQNNHAYKFMNQYNKSMTIGIAVQDGNYAGTTGWETNEQAKATNISNLISFAKNHLGANYIFWGAQEPYFSQILIPFLASDNVSL